MLIKLNYCVTFFFAGRTYDNCVKAILSHRIQTQSDVRICRQTGRDRPADGHIHTRTMSFFSVCLDILSHVRHCCVCQSASQPANQLSINSIEFLVIQSSFNRRTQTIKSHENCAVISMNHRHHRRRRPRMNGPPYNRRLIHINIGDVR